MGPSEEDQEDRERISEGGVAHFSSPPWFLARRGRPAGLLAFVVLLAGWPRSVEAANHGPTLAQPSEHDAHSPIRCKKDSDCRSPACGPCKPGERLEQGGPSCMVNPCPGVPVVCSPDGYCVVR
jgi:hypothetical protein